MLVVAVAERFGLHRARAPFEQTADLALQTRAGNVGTAGKRIPHNSVVDAANMHFSIASADMKTGEAAEIRTDRQDFGKFHGLVPTADQFLLLRDSKYFSKPRKASKKSFAA